MEQIRAKLMEENKSRPAIFTLATLRESSSSTPSSSSSSPEQRCQTAPAANSECRDRQACPADAGLALSHHDDGARAADHEPDFINLKLRGGASSFGHPIKMPLASTKGWSLDSLIAHAPGTFYHVDRVSAKLPPDELATKIEQYEQSGRPLVIEGFHTLPSWPKKKFTLDSFVKDAAEGESFV